MTETACNNSPLSFFLLDLSVRYQLDRNYSEVINSSFVLPRLHLNILETEEMQKNSRRAWHRRLRILRILRFCNIFVKKKKKKVKFYSVQNSLSPSGAESEAELKLHRLYFRNFLIGRREPTTTPALT